MPVRIQRLRTKGWRMPEGAVYVGRPGMFGNPFYSAAEYREWLDHGRCSLFAGKPLRLLGGKKNWADPVVAVGSMEHRRAVLGALAAGWLTGYDLACWCPLDGQPCHADVLLELANR